MRAALPLAMLMSLGLSGCGLSTGSEPPGDTRHPARSISDYDERLWAQRPQVELRYTVAPDLATATGDVSVRFTPDAPTCELVFRAWPNNPPMGRTGSSLTVTTASVDGAPVVPNVQAAGAHTGAPGTLVELPLSRCLAPGQSVRAGLGFELRLGRNSSERVGHDPDTGTAWFGSAFPLLSWVRGHGWTRDPAEPVYGETATSEAFTLTALDVTVPTGLQVAGVGRRVSQISGSTPGTTVHRFQADAVRDVTVSVGRYQISETGVNGVRVHLAVPSSGTKAAAAEWTAALSTSIDKLVGTFGPFPYADLWATVVPGHSGGWEFPGAVQLGDRAGPAVLVAHELAHQYFHGLVGNNQARDPWLDESFATLGEAVVLGEKYAYRLPDIRPQLRGQLGRPMSHWARHGGRPLYNEAVYQQGGAVLTELRAELGPAFDANLRGYLVDNAHRVAAPADLAAAFTDQPLVLARLREYGALPEG